MEGTGTVIGKLAPEFSLADAEGRSVSLGETCKKGPVLLAFYPGDFTLVCTKQLCNYRNNFEQFSNFGIQIIGISRNPPHDHKRFGDKYAFPFPLLTDPGSEVAKQFGCTTTWMLGKVSRAVFVLNKARVVLYRYVEPTVITHRSSKELLSILTDLKAASLI